ncbi:hypothetical protein Tco_0600198 [Tanacetum coccineum]|uniref:Reverse transcriptase n=1 Tax=Tanacetum coccineum TaxID=301880 RepID=A0ABQ4WB51_9ASTR
MIDELDPPRSSDFLPFPECDSVFYEDFSEVDAVSSTNNENKVFNPGILIHENLYEVTNCATMEKNVKKTTNASLIHEDFNPPLYELPFHKEVPGSETLLSFSSENEEKVFNPGILTSKGVHTSLLPELSHRGPKAFKVIKNFESPMEIFPCSYGEDIRILDVPCLHFGFDSCDPVDTPMEEKSKLDEDKEGKAVDPSHYRNMIGTLLYLIASRPDLQFSICMCARYQARPTEKHLHAIKRIFRYLKGTVNRGLWYSKDSLIALTTFTDVDHIQPTNHYKEES